ncbi:peptidase, S54 family [Ancylostoma caninum]|uniref:rhomboid protease n=1 Tax=Ancylostoma caninum TaxID=29170 RepID=A0A368GTS0_ANCCA|nr:peptidase, S54 family [Ancylostoma caninum]
MLLNQLLFRIPLRGFRSKALSYGRFSRESLRNRLHRHDIKQPFKAQTPPPPYAADTIPVRPISDLMKALGFTVAVGAGTFTVAIIGDYERQSHRLKTLFEKARFSSENGWKQLTDGDKCALYLVGANLVVFALWRVKRLQTFMWRYFSNSFASRSLCMPMALSVFSHYNLVHLALNMYVVWSFTNVAVDKFLGPDQFWAFFITAGVVSSLFGLAHKALTRSPIRAVGASGAILGVLGYTCMKIPEARLKIVFVPGFDFSAQSAIIGILLFDLAGLLFRFRMFDHAAHLGGTLFGVFYALIGDDLVWNSYGSIVERAYRHLKNG